MALTDRIPSRHLAAGTEELLHRLRDLQPGLIAVSGGIDSRVLFGLARAADLDFEPLFFTGPHMSTRDCQRGRECLAAWGDTGYILELDPLREEAVRANDRSRCYHCKRLLFSRAAELAGKLDRPHIAEGSHSGDLKEHRPGRLALRELGIASPLADASLDKADIRELARILNLAPPDMASRPCLLTRFAYDRTPSPEELERIGRLEDELADLGLNNIRLRVLRDGSRLLQIARDEEELLEAKRGGVEQALARHGLDPCPIRITERISGFFDHG
jgi:uncharacterized protein